MRPPSAAPHGPSRSPRRRARQGPRRAAIALIAALGGLAVACSSGTDATPSTDGVTVEDLLAVALGGDGSTGLANRNAFSQPNRSLPGSERGRFEVGDSFFTQKWVTAPASTTSRDGLGPLFNAEACASCHVLDGRGEPPDGDHPDRPGLLFRLSVPDGEGTADEPAYGGQLQDHAILGILPEGQMDITYSELDGTFADGTPYSLLSPSYAIADPAYGAVADDVLISPRIAPPVIGTGLLEAVPEVDIVSRADPDDTDDDGISGRPNWVTDPSSGTTTLGRLGWKANVASVEAQTAGAFLGDLGVTSPLHREADCTAVELDCAAAIDGGDPEVDDQTFDAVVFYTRVVAVPERRPTDDGSDADGAQLFLDAGCASCHTPTLTTGTTDIPALSNQVIHPYTDLLLHDMGEGLADGRPDGEATGTEWRTAPLWGIGLTETVNGHTRFLHDGRARDLSEAILWHGGEAEASKEEYLTMTEAERDALLAYLESL